MPAQRSNQSLLWELQDNLSADLFASAAPLRLAADEALFLAGDSGDGCYLQLFVGFLVMRDQLS